MKNKIYTVDRAWSRHAVNPLSINPRPGAVAVLVTQGATTKLYEGVHSPINYAKAVWRRDPEAEVSIRFGQEEFTYRIRKGQYFPSIVFPWGS